jgi:hypothetical protein
MMATIASQSAGKPELPEAVSQAASNADLLDQLHMDCVVTPEPVPLRELGPATDKTHPDSPDLR